MLDLISVGSPIDAALAKWAELPSIRQAALSSLTGTVLPVVSVAQRTFNVYKVFFFNAANGASSIGTLFSGMSIIKLGMATRTCLSDLKNAVQRVYRSINHEHIQDRIYNELLELSRSTVATVLTVSGLLQRSLPARFLTNHLAFLSSLGYGSLFILLVLGILSNSYNSVDKKEFEEALASSSKPKNAVETEEKLDESVKKLTKFFGLEEIEPKKLNQAISKNPDMNAVFSEQWEKHQSQEIDGYLAKIVFGEESPGETNELRALRFQENKEKFIQWTNLECYKTVAKWLGIALSEEDLLPSSKAPIQTTSREAEPVTLRLRTELLANIFQTCFETTVATYFKKTTSALSTGALFTMIFSAKFFLVAAPASICLLLITILQIRENQPQEFILSQLRDNLSERPTL